MDLLVQSIADTGFPIVLSLYLLIRLEGKIEDLTDSIRDLNRALTGEEVGRKE